MRVTVKLLAAVLFAAAIASVDAKITVGEGDERVEIDTDRHDIFEDNLGAAAVEAMARAKAAEEGDEEDDGEEGNGEEGSAHRPIGKSTVTDLMTRAEAIMHVNFSEISLDEAERMQLSLLPYLENFQLVGLFEGLAALPLPKSRSAHHTIVDLMVQTLIRTAMRMGEAAAREAVNMLFQAITRSSAERAVVVEAMAPHLTEEEVRDLYPTDLNVDEDVDEGDMEEGGDDRDEGMGSKDTAPSSAFYRSARRGAKVPLASPDLEFESGEGLASLKASRFATLQAGKWHSAEAPSSKAFGLDEEEQVEEEEDGPAPLLESGKWHTLEHAEALGKVVVMGRPSKSSTKAARMMEEVVGAEEEFTPTAKSMLAATMTAGKWFQLPEEEETTTGKDLGELDGGEEEEGAFVSMVRGKWYTLEEVAEEASEVAERDVDPKDVLPVGFASSIYNAIMRVMFPSSSSKSRVKAFRREPLERSDKPRRKDVRGKRDEAGASSDSESTLESIYSNYSTEDEGARAEEARHRHNHRAKQERERRCAVEAAKTGGRKKKST